MNYYTGIDVSKQTLKVFDGVKDYEVKNEKGMKAFKKALKERYGKEWKEVRLIYEPTGPYSNYLREFASLNQLKVYEVNPKRSANFAKTLGNRSKTDTIDARMLYSFSLLLKEHNFHVPVIDEVVEKLGTLLHSYEMVQKTRTMLSNHLTSMKYKNGSVKIPKDAIEKEARRLKKTEENLEKEIKAFIESIPEWKEDFHNLLTIKCVGTITAAVLLYVFKKYPKTNRNEVTALTGLDPIKKETGLSKGKERISKQGDPMIRKILYTSCMSCIQYNDYIKTFYHHLIDDNHKKPKEALIACMRKLLLLAHYIYTNKTTYAPVEVKQNEKAKLTEKTETDRKAETAEKKATNKQENVKVTVKITLNEKTKKNKKVGLDEKPKQNKKHDTTDKHLCSTLLTKS